MKHLKNIPHLIPEDIYPLQWTENIWLLGVQEFPSFLVVGENAGAIIEAGASLLVPKILSDLKKLNLSTPLKYLVVTHAHADHVGGLIELKRIQPNLLLVGSRSSADMLSKKKIVKNFAREDVRYGKYLAGKGVVEEKQKIPGAEPLKFDNLVDNNELIDLGHVHLQFIDALGHAPGSIAILVKPDNAILISDSAGYAKSENDIYPLFFHNYSWFIDSLRKLKTFQPDHLGLGHNLTIDGKAASQEFLDHAINTTRQMKKWITQNTHSKISQEKVAGELADCMNRYGLLGSFSRDTQIGLAQLLIKRSVEG